VQVFELQRKVIADYEAYIRGFLVIRDGCIQSLVDEALTSGHLWPDPLIQLNPSFEPGPAMQQLVANGELHPHTLHIFQNARGEPLTLHRHQVEGLRAAARKKPYVVTTGTGSGKSLSYILPIVHEALSAPTQGKIQAIIVYPMNALVNSQLNELTKYLGTAPAVSFAAYTGQNKEEERRALLANPPTILLTNYVMLELLLTRPEEAQLIHAAQGLRWLVLDELHTYRGRQGADVALLCRRVRAACHAPELLVVGTSATLVSSGDPAAQQAEIARVASQLFGVEVPPEHVIRESLIRATDPVPPTPQDLLDALTSDAPLPTTREALARHPLARWLEATLGVREEEGRLVRQPPRALRGPDGLAALLAQHTNQPQERCLDVLEAVLLAGAQAMDAANRPLFAFRMHQFISKGEAVWGSLEPPDVRFLSVHPQQFVPHSGRQKLLFPMAFCRECGQEYYVVTYHKGSVSARAMEDQLGDDEEESGSRAGYLYLDDPASPWPTDPTAQVERLPDFLVTQSTRGPKAIKPEVLPIPLALTPLGQPHGALRALFVQAPFRWCLCCGVAYADGQRRDFARLATLGSEGRSTATTVLATSAIRRVSEDPTIPAHTRKLLSFTDNRQDASLQAGHFNDFVQLVRLRAALYAALTQAPEGLEHDTIHMRVMQALALEPEEFAQDPDIASKVFMLPNVETALRNALGYMLYKDQARGWRITSPNLEQCGLMEVFYKNLDVIVAHEPSWAATRFADVDPAVRLVVSRTLLDFMRRELAIRVDYLHPELQDPFMRQSSQHLREPWAIHEGERVTARFVTTAPSSARGRTAGAKLALIHLTPRSNFGRYLRRPATLGPAAPQTTEETQQALDELLKVLTACGLLSCETPRGTTQPVYQVDAGVLCWRAGDGKRAAHDPVRVPHVPDEGLRTNPYFVQLYRGDQRPLAHLKAQEHTAQIHSDERKLREQAFTEARLPVMFCSPTMELGVDISQLQLVNMRNVPPTPANYAQRSGRAGRSGQPALVLNYCTTGSPHDQYFFRNPLRMVSGAVTPPRIDLSNEELLRAHIHAIWLSAAGLSLGKTLADVLDLTQTDTLPPLPSIAAQLTSPPTLALARDRALSALADVLRAHAPGQDAVAFVEQTLAALPQTFDGACARWRDLYRSARAQAHTQHALTLDPTRSAEDREVAKRLHDEALAQLNLLQDASRAAESDFYSYRYFASEGFLPGYNFPRLPLSAYLPARGRLTSRDEFLNRPRFLAISEFGPKSIIYHNGARYTVQRVFMPAGQSTLTRRATLCPVCGELHPITTQVPPDCCVRCGAQLPPPMTNLFRMQNVVARIRERINSDEEERQRNGYDLKSGVAMPRQTTSLKLDDGGQARVALVYGHAATVWRINQGWRHRARPEQMGFPLDTERGDWVTKKDEDGADPQQLGRRIQRVVPYVEDRRNCLLVRPLPPLPKAVMASLEAALKSAIQRTFQIEDRELACEPLPDRDARDSILFYEATEGGAGVLARLVAEPAMLERTLREAIALCHFDPDTGEDLDHAPGASERCEAACYDCLLSYFNQPDHALVDRFALLPVLQAWRACLRDSYPSEAPHAASASSKELPAPTPHTRAFLELLKSEKLRLPDTFEQDHYRYYEARACVFIAPDRPDRRIMLDLEDRGWDILLFEDPASWITICRKNPSVFS
jgi:ATP-dependent helicase YprA (DUF1998 family)